MTAASRNWRIRVTPFIETEVERLARREGRSLSNMLGRLIGEALEHRNALRRADAQAGPHVA